MNHDPLPGQIARLEQAILTILQTLGQEISDTLDEDITLPQFYILRYLHFKGSSTVSDLANRMHVKPSAITSIIDRMVRNGLVSRERDTEDRRIVRIQLSENGLTVLSRSEEKRRYVIEKYLKLLDFKEMEFLIEIYEKLARELNNKNGEFY